MRALFLRHGATGLRLPDAHPQQRLGPLAVWHGSQPVPVLTLHTAGLAVLVGVNAAFDLRLLGFGRQIALTQMEPFFPAMWMGFWVNAITGAMLFAIDPITKGTTTLFMIKLGFVGAGVILIVLLRRTVYGCDRDAASVTPLAKTCAALSLFVWVGAITTGRLMAYL